MNARIYGSLWLTALCLILVCSTPAAGQPTGLLGVARVTAGTYLSGDYVSDVTFLGNHVGVVAPKHNARAGAFPSDNSNYAWGEAFYNPGTRDHGGDGAADSTVFYEVEDAKGNVVSGLNILHMKFKIAASTDNTPGSRSNAEARAIILEDIGKVGVQVLYLEAHDFLGGTLRYMTNFGVDKTIIGKSYFDGTLDFFETTGEFHVLLTAGATLTGIGIVDPTFSLDNPNLRLVSLSPENPNPGAQLPTASELSALSANGVDLSGFVATGLISVPEPPVVGLFGVGLLALVGFHRLVRRAV
jgi:hypothetical protein